MLYSINGNELYLENYFFGSREERELKELLDNVSNNKNIDTLRIGNHALRSLLIMNNPTVFEQFKTIVLPPDSAEIAEYMRENRELPFVSIPLWNKSFKPEKIIFDEGTEIIDHDLLRDCDSLKKVVLPNSLTKISNRAFKGCKNLEYVDIPSNTEFIGDNAFDGCDSLKKITWAPADRYLFDVDSFMVKEKNKDLVVEIKTQNQFNIYVDDGDLNYIYGDNQGNVHYCNNLPEDRTNVRFPMSLLELDDIYDQYVFDGRVICIDEVVAPAYKVALKIGTNKVPYKFAKSLEINNMVDYFTKNCDVRFFKNEKIADKYFREDETGLYKFAMILGCFSRDTYYKNGKETCLMAQKASSLLAKLLKENCELSRKIEDFSYADVNKKADPAFLDFIAQKGPGGKYDNLQMLLSLDKAYASIFESVMADFSRVAEYRKVFNDGKLKTIPWEEAIINYCISSKYNNVTPENEDIARLLIARNFSQEEFEKACNIREEQNRCHVPHHILNKELKEKTILDEIEEIKSKFEKSVEKSKKLVLDICSKKFTYEMLDKYDPRNFAIGVYCDCCCSINSVHYGKSIAEAALLRNNVQHIIINDMDGHIVGKGTIYINPEERYGVINEFDVIPKYKLEPPKYNVEDTRNMKLVNEDRKLIFQAFKRAIEAFAKEYRLVTGDKLKKITVGMSHNNKLLDICKEECTTIRKPLVTPKKIEFNDASKEQAIVYRKIF